MEKVVVRPTFESWIPSVVFALGETRSGVSLYSLPTTSFGTDLHSNSLRNGTKHPTRSLEIGIGRRRRGAIPAILGNWVWDHGFRRVDSQLLAVMAYATHLHGALLLSILEAPGFLHTRIEHDLGPVSKHCSNEESEASSLGRRLHVHADNDYIHARPPPSWRVCYLCEYLTELAQVHRRQQEFTEYNTESINMNSRSLNRRTLLVGAVSAAAATVPYYRAMAWSLPAINTGLLTAGTWFEQVKAQHLIIAETLTEIIGFDGSASTERTAALNQLSYLLTAHSVAEENVLYPALVFAGLTVDSADLYLEQQFQKVWNAEIDLKAEEGEAGNEWLEKVKRLQSIILEHAKAHEEENYYPKLQEKLNSAQNAKLSAQFRAQFLLVKQP